MKISIVSLGCSKNLVDSELITGNLLKHGHELADEKDADVIVVNTCGFVGDAKRESINTTLDMAEYKKAGSCKKLILTGCLVERYRDELEREIPEVDAFWGTGNLFQIHKLLEDEHTDYRIYKPGTLYDPDSPRVLSTKKHYAYVKVSEGCSRTCSFCIIPRMRGKMVSRPVQSIRGEMENLAKQGVKEVNLIAQDMTSYGRDIGTDLNTMLRDIAQVEGIEWIRIHYCYPWGMTDELMETINREHRILPYIDMPIQHINDRILRLMDRKTPKKRITDIIKRLRERIEGVTLRSTFIVGFPGETDDEFEELLDFIKETGFDRAGAFKYSREEGTKSWALKGHVSEDIKEERYERFMEVQSGVSLANNKRLIGTIHRAVVEEEDENGVVYARLHSQAPEVDGITYLANADNVSSGEIVDVEVTDADFYDLHAEIVNNQKRI